MAIVYNQLGFTVILPSPPGSGLPPQVFDEGLLSNVGQGIIIGVPGTATYAQSQVATKAAMAPPAQPNQISTPVKSGGASMMAITVDKDDYIKTDLEQSTQLIKGSLPVQQSLKLLPDISHLPQTNAPLAIEPTPKIIVPVSTVNPYMIAVAVAIGVLIFTGGKK